LLIGDVLRFLKQYFITKGKKTIYTGKGDLLLLQSSPTEKSGCFVMPMYRHFTAQDFPDLNVKEISENVNLKSVYDCTL
jgi:hypothetical protein